MNKENESNNKVLLIIRGGTIQAVFCSDKNFTVNILDYDDEEFLDDKFAEMEFENQRNNLFELDIN